MMTGAICAAIFLFVVLMEISIDSQLRRIEQKINTLLDDTFDLLMAKREQEDEQRLDD